MTLSVLEFLFPTRFHAILAGIVALIGGIACFVPLVNLIGYESAALFGVVGGVAALIGVTHDHRNGEGGLPCPAENPRSPIEQWFRLTVRYTAYLLAPAALLGLNALRVENCDPATGIAFWLLIPLPAVAIATAMALLAQWWAWGRRWKARMGVILLFGATVLDFALRLALEPPIVGYHAFLGYFSGSIYDEALSIPTGLVAYRGIQTLGIAALLLAMQGRWLETAGRNVRSVAIAASFLALLWAGLFAERDRWNVDLTGEEVAERLGGQVESEHFVIYYPANARFDDEEVARLVEDHEFRYAEMAEFFGTDPVELHGEKVRSFVYADRNQKGDLTGARRTLVAKIWLGEMHILWRQYGDHMLAHELAHVFTEPFSSGPLRLSTRWGVGINMGLVEGAATAADWHSGELTPHQSSAALKRLDRAPDLRRLVGASGFWTQSSGRAYTLVGSFIRFLVERYGMEPFRQAYPHGDFAAAYGKPVDELVAEWEEFLDGVNLSASDMERARFLYDRRSIFEKVCARTIAELRVDADKMAAAGEAKGVRETYETIVGFAPRNVRYRLEYARVLVMVDAIDDARAQVAELLERDDLTSAETAQVLHMLGDLSWREADVEGARTIYEQAMSSGLPADYERLIGAKLAALEREERQRQHALQYLVVAPEAPYALYHPVSWRGEVPDDPLAAYLVGRRLWSGHEYEEAIPHLRVADGRLPDGPLRWENRRLLAQSSYWVGELDEAARLFDQLSSVDRSTYAVEAEEWLRRVEWQRRNRLQGPGG